LIQKVSNEEVFNFRSQGCFKANGRYAKANGDETESDE